MQDWITLDMWFVDHKKTLYEPIDDDLLTKQIEQWLRIRLDDMNQINNLGFTDDQKFELFNLYKKTLSFDQSYSYYRYQYSDKFYTRLGPRAFRVYKKQDVEAVQNFCNSHNIVYEG